MTNTQSNNAVVHIVDDDHAITESLVFLIESVGLKTKIYDNPQNFLNNYKEEHPECLVLDIRMPGMSGLELQRRLNFNRQHIPIIFMSGHGDITMAVQAMKMGARDFLIKPFSDEALLEAIHQALRYDTEERKNHQELSLIEKQIEGLTPREYEVMRFVVNGTLNKNISAELGIGEKTVEIHRARIMRKMETRSLAQLVRKVAYYEQMNTSKENS